MGAATMNCLSLRKLIHYLKLPTPPSTGISVVESNPLRFLHHYLPTPNCSRAGGCVRRCARSRCSNLDTSKGMKLQLEVNFAKVKWRSITESEKKLKQQWLKFWITRPEKPMMHPLFFIAWQVTFKSIFNCINCFGRKFLEFPSF